MNTARSWSSCVSLDDKGRKKFSFTYETVNENEFNKVKEMIEAFYRVAPVIGAIEDSNTAEWLEVLIPTELEDSPDVCYHCSHCRQPSPFYTPFCPVCGKLMTINYRFGYTDGERVMGRDVQIPVMYSATQEQLELFYKQITGLDYDSKSCSIQINLTGGEIE